MRRMLLYALAVPVALLAGALAWAMPEAGLAFAGLGIALVWSVCWAARRFPAMQRVHFRAAALVALGSSIALGVVFPSTKLCCVGPVPGARTGIRESVCGGVCAIDRHMTIRLAIFAVGVVVAWALTALASRRETLSRSILS